MTILGALVAVKTALWVWAGISVGICVIDVVNGQIGPAVFAAFNTVILFSCAYILGLVFNSLEDQPPNHPG